MRRTACLCNSIPNAPEKRSQFFQSIWKENDVSVGDFKTNLAQQTGQFKHQTRPDTFRQNLYNNSHYPTFERNANKLWERKKKSE